MLDHEQIIELSASIIMPFNSSIVLILHDFKMISEYYYNLLFQGPEGYYTIATVK